MIVKNTIMKPMRLPLAKSSPELSGDSVFSALLKMQTIVHRPS